jgi:hypothetical protein
MTAHEWRFPRDPWARELTLPVNALLIPKSTLIEVPEQARLRVPAMPPNVPRLALTLTEQEAFFVRVEVPQVSLKIVKSLELLKVGAPHPLRVPNPEFVRITSLIAVVLPILTFPKSTGSST